MKNSHKLRPTFSHQLAKDIYTKCVANSIDLRYYSHEDLANVSIRLAIIFEDALQEAEKEKVKNNAD